MTPAYTLSLRMRWLCRAMQALAALSAIFLIWVGISDDIRSTIIDGYWNSLDEEQQRAVLFSPAKKALLHIIATISWISPVLVYFGVWRAFGAFASGPPLSLKAVRAVRFLGWMIFARAIASIATQPVMIGAFTYDSGPGMRVLSLGIGTHQTLNLMLGVAFIVIGHIFTQAVAAAEENKQFI